MRVLVIFVCSLCLCVSGSVRATEPATDEKPAPADGQPVRAAIDVPEAKGPHRWVNEGGPYGGIVKAVALCHDEPDVLYAGGVNGVHKSIDGGRTWRAVSALAPDGCRTMVCHVAVDPKTSDTVYAISQPPYGSGDTNALYRSTDGGQTWRKLEPRPGWSFLRVVVDAKDPNTLYLVAKNRGILKSTDGGTTWASENGGLWNRKFLLLASDEHDPNLLVVGMQGHSAVFGSDDGGVTWRKTGGVLDGITIGALKRSRDDPKHLELGLRLGASPMTTQVSDNGGTSWHLKEGARNQSHTFCGLLVDNEDPSRMEICVCLSGPASEFYLSTDGAETWRRLELPSPFPLAFRAGRSADGVLFILVREQQNMAYYYSDDDGKTWEFLYSPEKDPLGRDTSTIAELERCGLLGFYDEVWTYSWHLTFHPTNPEVAYKTSSADRGVVRTSDRGLTWTPIDEGLVASAVGDVACDAKTPGLLYAYALGAVYRSVDGARTWNGVCNTEGAWEPWQMRLIQPLAASPLDPRVVLISDERWGRMSTDGGRSWRYIEGPLRQGSHAAAFLFDPEDADHICILAKDGIVASTDRGATWQRTPGTYQCGRPVRREWPEGRQTNTKIIYEISVPGYRTLRRSRDLGQTWKDVTRPTRDRITYSFVRADPDDPKIVFAYTLSGLFRSADAGDTWQQIELPADCSGIDCIGLDPKDADTFYLGGCGDRETVLRTRNGGKTFEQLSNGLPGIRITRIAVSPADGAVYVATEGAGVYRLDIEEKPNSKADDGN